ncbi:hypothetical protein ACTFIW_000045 [Dictyostelium discoideum]
MSTTVNNNKASISTFTRFMKEHMFSSNTNSRSQRTHDDYDTESEQSEDESSNNVDVPTDYQLSDTLIGQYKHMVNNQGLLVEEECILKKDEISELNKVFNFPSNFQVNVAPFGTPEGISVSSTVKNNDTDLLIVEKRINDSLKPLLLMSSMLSSDSSNSAIVLAVNAQASLSRVRRNNIAKEIYGFEVLLPIKIKDTPKMFDETETERVRKLAKSIRKNNEAKQSLLKLNNHSKYNAKKSVNSSGNNTTRNSSNSKSSSESYGRSNNFNGSPSNKLDFCSPRKLADLKGKLIALKDAVIPFRLNTHRTNKFHSQCLTLANGDWDQSFPIPQDVKSEISHWLTVLNQWNGKEFSLFPSYDYVLTTDSSESGAVATLKKGNKTIKTWSFQWSTTQSNMSSNRREMLALLVAYQALWWSDTGPISSVRTTLETMPQEESELDMRAYSRILQCKSRPHQPSFRDESQIIVQSNQELQLATEEGSVQSHPTSVRSNTDGSVRISPEPSNVQLLNNQNESTPPRLESMEAMSGLPTTNSFTFYPGENELIQFEEGFYNTDLPNLDISNLVSDDSSSSSSSSSSHVSSSHGNIPRSIDQTISRVNTNPNSTTGSVSAEDRLFDAFVQIGSGAAIACYFVKKRKKIGAFDPIIPKRLSLFSLVTSSLPVIFMGMLFHSNIIENLYNLSTVSCGFLVASSSYLFKRIKKEPELTQQTILKNYLIIGIFPIFSLIPEVSRSGATIVGGLISLISLWDSIQLSFLYPFHPLLEPEFMSSAYFFYRTIQSSSIGPTSR